MNTNRVEIKMTWEEIRKSAIRVLRDEYNQLTDEEFEAAYILCDGFGTITVEQAREFGFDRSHYRDSSYDALYKVLQWHLERLTAKGPINRRHIMPVVIPVGQKPVDELEAAGIALGFVTISVEVLEAMAEKPN